MNNIDENEQKNLTQTPPTPPSIPLNDIQNISINNNSYTKIGNDIVIENVNSLSDTRTELLRTFKEIQNNPNESKHFNSLSPKEQEKYLVNKVVGDWKIKHQLQNASEQTKAPTKVEATTTSIAANKQDDVKVNSEIGLIVNEQDGTITKVEEQTDDSIQVTETNSVNKSEIINPQNEDYNNEISQNDDYYKNYQSQNSQSTEQNAKDAYLNEEGIQNPNYTQNIALGTALGVGAATLANNKAYVKKRTLQPNHYNNFRRPGGYINLQMIIIILTLSTIIGITLGSLLYMSTR
jgi:hypothetical protein